jgi:hypothetical protein
MRESRFLRVVSAALLAFSLVGCTRKNGSHTEPAPVE